MMKEFQEIQNINIRLAQKFEKMGYFKEADRVDNFNLMLSQRIRIAKGPTEEQLNDIGRSIDSSINTPKFLKGIELAIEKLTGKPFPLASALGAPAIVTFISRLFSLGILSMGIYNFFIGITNDMSGTHGDTPKEKVLIASYLSDIASGISYLVSISSGSAPLAATGGVLALVGFLTRLLSSYMTDEIDYGKKEYPGGAEQLAQDAFKVEFPEANNTFKNTNFSNVSAQIIQNLKNRILKIVQKGNYTTTSLQQAYQIIDSKISNLVNTPNARELAKLTDLKPNLNPNIQSSKPVDKALRGFDVPFTP